MALVSHQHGFIYLKTFKTGGTSTEMALQGLCTPPGTKVKHYGPAILSDVGIVGARGKFTQTEKTGWHSHMSAKKVAWKLGPLKWLRYHKIASVRNPFDKAVSWYWFATQKTPRPEQGSVEDFRAFLREQDAAGYFRSAEDIDWRVTHLMGRPVIDHYLRLEHLQEDLAALCAKLGVADVSLDVPQVKAKSRKQDPRDVPEYFDAATADILRRGWGWIFEAGGYSLDPADAGRASRADAPEPGQAGGGAETAPEVKRRGGKGRGGKRAAAEGKAGKRATAEGKPGKRKAAKRNAAQPDAGARRSARRAG